MLDKEKEINEGINDCFLNLKHFINSNKAQIKEANNCLKNYPRSHFKKILDNFVQELESEGKKKNQDKLNISDKIKTPKKLVKKTKKKELFKVRIISSDKNKKESYYKKKIFKGKEKQNNNSLKMPQIGDIQIPKKILINNSFEKYNDNNSYDNSSCINSSININNIIDNSIDEKNNNKNLGNDKVSDSNSNNNISDGNLPSNSLAYSDLKLQSKCSDEEEEGGKIISEKSSKIIANKLKKFNNDSEREKDNLSKKSRTTATFCSSSIVDVEEHLK